MQKVEMQHAGAADPVAGEIRRAVEHSLGSGPGSYDEGAQGHEEQSAAAHHAS
jgi:hypothetical protein